MNASDDLDDPVADLGEVDGSTDSAGSIASDIDSPFAHMIFMFNGQDASALNPDDHPDLSLALVKAFNELAAMSTPDTHALNADLREVKSWVDTRTHIWPRRLRPYVSRFVVKVLRFLKAFATVKRSARRAGRVGTTANLLRAKILAHAASFIAQRRMDSTLSLVQRMQSNDLTIAEILDLTYDLEALIREAKELLRTDSTRRAFPCWRDWRAARGLPGITHLLETALYDAVDAPPEVDETVDFSTLHALYQLYPFFQGLGAFDPSKWAQRIVPAPVPRPFPRIRQDGVRGHDGDSSDESDEGTSDETDEDGNDDSLHNKLRALTTEIQVDLQTNPPGLTNVDTIVKWHAGVRRRVKLAVRLEQRYDVLGDTEVAIYLHNLAILLFQHQSHTEAAIAAEFLVICLRVEVERAPASVDARTRLCLALAVLGYICTKTYRDVYCQSSRAPEAIHAMSEAISILDTLSDTRTDHDMVRAALQLSLAALLPAEGEELAARALPAIQTAVDQEPYNLDAKLWLASALIHNSKNWGTTREIMLDLTSAKLHLYGPQVVHLLGWAANRHKALDVETEMRKEELTLLARISADWRELDVGESLVSAGNLLVYSHERRQDWDAAFAANETVIQILAADPALIKAHFEALLRRATLLFRKERYRDTLAAAKKYFAESGRRGARHLFHSTAARALYLVALSQLCVGKPNAAEDTLFQMSGRIDKEIDLHWTPAAARTSPSSPAKSLEAICVRIGLCAVACARGEVEDALEQGRIVVRRVSKYVRAQQTSALEDPTWIEFGRAHTFLAAALILSASASERKEKSGAEAEGSGGAPESGEEGIGAGDGGAVGLADRLSDMRTEDREDETMLIDEEEHEADAMMSDKDQSATKVDKLAEALALLDVAIGALPTGEYKAGHAAGSLLKTARVLRARVLDVMGDRQGEADADRERAEALPFAGFADRLLPGM
ncbi:hypothetical protein OC834_003744 [Tilletia horrida]|nr:hypothetical protein OC834_003744 [Tilletia horrida]